MSQISAFGTSGSKQITGLAADEFATLAFTTSVAGSFSPGTFISGGTSGAVAKVSGQVDPFTLRIKAVRANPTAGTNFTDGETINGFVNQASTTACSATAGTTAYAMQKKRIRTNSVAGTTTNSFGVTLTTGNIGTTLTGGYLARASGSWYADGVVPGSVFNVTSHSVTAVNQQYTVVAVANATLCQVSPAPTNAAAGSGILQASRYAIAFDAVTVDDTGIKQAHRFPGRSTADKEVKNATRMMLSKTQSTDTTAVPVTTWTMPAAATYSIASATPIVFYLNSNEALEVIGSPRIALLSTANTVLTAGNLTFNVAKTIARATGTWASDGMYAGSRFAVTSSVSNNATFTIASVDVTGKIATVVESVTTEGSVAATTTAQVGTIYANYNPNMSTDMRIAFTVPASTPALIGQIQSATYSANSGTIKDMGAASGTTAGAGIGSTITPASMGSVTGILLGV